MALEFGSPRQAIESHVDSEDVQKLDTIDSMGRTQQRGFFVYMCYTVCLHIHRSKKCKIQDENKRLVITTMVTEICRWVSQ